MKRSLSIIWILLFASVTFSQWIRTNGPEGASISSLFTIDGTIYAGSGVEGLFVSTDDGKNWQPMNAGIEDLEVTAIARNQDGYLLAATFGGGVFHSVDNGQSWLAPSNARDLAVTAMVVKDSFIFAGTIDQGIYRSSDNGATWTQKLSGFTSIQALCVSGNSVFASSSVYGFRSDDNGESWSDVSIGLTTIWSFYTRDSLILAGGVNEIYRSTDHGYSFTTMPLNFSFSSVNIYSIVNIGSTYFIATSYDGVYKSEDDGNTWVPMNEGMGPRDVRALTTTESSTIIAGTHYVGIYRSTDMGSQWSKSMAGLPAGSSIHSLLASGESVFAGTRDGVYRTDNNGMNWMKLAGTNDTTKYGDVWGMCELDGIIFATMQIHFDASVYRSIDKGATWIRCESAGLPQGLPFIKALATSGDNIVAGTDDGIYYSPDKGASWYQTNVPNRHISGIAASGNYVYAPVLSIGIYRSSDYGVHWSLVFQGGVDFIVVAALENYAFAGSFFGGARYSSNYGTAWYKCSGFQTDASIFAVGPVGDGMVLAGTDLRPNWIYLSNNNGVTFSPYSEGLAANAAVEAFTSNDSFMFAGSDYHGVWRRLRPNLVNIQPEPDAEQTFELAQNYPNPFNASTKFQIQISRPSFVTLKIYKITGEEVATLISASLLSGSYEYRWDAGDMASGVYLYRLQAGDFVQTRKMVLMR